MILRICAFLLAAATVAAATADTVTVIASSPQADEQGLVKGKATFLRTGTTGPLRITYAITGEALSSLHGGYVGAVERILPGANYLEDSFVETLTGATDATSFNDATITVLSTGGQITGAYVITTAGSGYDPDAPPSVYISGGGGNGAVARSVLTGYVIGVSISTAGAGLTDGFYPNRPLSGGGGSGATADITVSGGTVTGALISNGGSNYTSDPTFTLSGGVGSTAALISGAIDYRVARIDVVSGGTGYTSTPSVWISLPPNAGTQAEADAPAPTGSGVSGLSVKTPGYGYILPSIDIAPVLVTPSRNAVARAVVVGGGIDQVVIEDPGYGYAVPTVTITGQTSGATSAKARVVLTDDDITDVRLVDPGSGYTDGETVVVTTSGANSTTFSVTLSAGQVTSIAVVASGGGYAFPAVTAVDPTASGGGATFHVITEASDATANSGQITAITVATAGSGFPTPSVVIADGFGGAGATAQFTLVGSDYTAPAGTSLVAGVLTGHLDFAAGQARVDLEFTPRRNGLGGGRTLQVNLLAAGSTYTVGAQNNATITIADGDVEASIATVLPVAYPTLPTMGSGLPIELQGRAEWYVDLIGDLLERDVSVVIDGDEDVAPTATPADCDLIWSGRDILDASITSIVVQQDPTSLTETAPGPSAAGTQVIPVQYYQMFEVGDAVVFENPTSVLNGYYRVTSVDAPTTDGFNGTITVSPGLRVIQTGFGTTMVRQFGRFVDADLVGDVVTAIPSRFSVIGLVDQLYFWALPLKRGPAALASTSRSVNINLVQSADFRTLSPTSATAVIAADDASLGLRWIANAGQPSTNGVVQVVSSTAFDTDVDVPFIITIESGATFGSHYAITGVDAGTLVGSIRLPAGQTTAQLEIQPGATALATAGSITIALLQSYDYLLEPSGTSPVNPTVQITIAPGLTIGGDPVYLTVTPVQGETEGGSSGLKFRVKATDSLGVALVGNLTSNLGFTYSMSGSATVTADYVTPTGTATIPAGSNETTITIAVADDNIVEGNETVQLTLNGGPGFQIAPNGGSASAVITDNEPVFTVTAGTAPVEGGVHGTFTLTNQNQVGTAITVLLAVSGTADPATDYAPIATSVLFPANSTTATITVVAADEGTYDPGETVILTVLPDTAPTATYGVQTGADSATLTIGDTKPIMSIALAVASASEGGANGRFTISNTNPALPTVAVVVSINASGTATAGSDYTALPATVTIPASTASVTVDVVALTDAETDPDETVVVALGSGAGYSIDATANSVTVTIVDDAVVPPGSGGDGKPGLGSGDGGGGCGAGASGMILAGAFGLLGLRRRRRVV